MLPTPLFQNAALPGLLPPAKKGVAAGSHVAHHQGMFQHHPAMYQQALASMKMNSQPSHYIPPPSECLNRDVLGSVCVVLFLNFNCRAKFLKAF